MTTKRVFILGAGFSKQVGMPLATELTSLILDGERLRDLEDMQVWLADFKRRLAAVEGVGNDASAFVPNIEELFDFAKYDVELWRMKQQLCPVGRGFGPDTPWSKADDIETWLDYMEEDLWHIIWDEQKKANCQLDAVIRFTECLSSDDAILTFNYDTLVETALSARGQKWNHGLNDRLDGGVQILKMHGSVDWLLLERKPEGEMETFVKLFSKGDVNVEEHGHPAPSEGEYAWELWRAKDADACNAVVDMDKSDPSGFCCSRGLAGLGNHKPLHKLPGSAQTWFAAFEALRSADEIYVIGFSMSAYDTMMRFHFASVIHDRPRPPSKVIVIDPSADRLAKTGRVVFGIPPIPELRGAEEVDWQKMLGG